MRRLLDLRLAVPLAALLLAVSSHAGPTTGEVPIWVETTPTTRPPVFGFSFPLVYDAVAERVVFPIDADMWSYDGVAWTLFPGSGPSVPSGFLSLAAFDPARGVFVGYAGPDDVWEWRSGTWTHAAPGAPDLAQLVYDDRLGKIVGISAPAARRAARRTAATPPAPASHGAPPMSTAPRRRSAATAPASRHRRPARARRDRARRKGRSKTARRSHASQWAEVAGPRAGRATIAQTGFSARAARFAGARCRRRPRGAASARAGRRPAERWAASVRWRSGLQRSWRARHGDAKLRS